MSALYRACYIFTVIGNDPAGGLLYALTASVFLR